MKDCEGWTDREILVSILEKVETLFICVNKQEETSDDHEGKIRDIELYIATCKGSNETAEKIATRIANRTAIYTGVGSVILTIVTVIIMYLTLIR
jgi:hypothetical protein